MKNTSVLSSLRLPATETAAVVALLEKNDLAPSAVPATEEQRAAALRNPGLDLTRRAFVNNAGFVSVAQLTPENRAVFAVRGKGVCITPESVTKDTAFIIHPAPVPKEERKAAEPVTFKPVPALASPAPETPAAVPLSTLATVADGLRKVTPTRAAVVEYLRISSKRPRKAPPN